MRALLDEVLIDQGCARAVRRGTDRSGMLGGLYTCDCVFFNKYKNHFERGCRYVKLVEMKVKGLLYSGSN